MKKGLFFYPDEIKYSSNNAFAWLQEEASKFDLQIDIHFFDEVQYSYGSQYNLLINGQVVDDVDFVVIRGYNEMLSMHFELQGIPVINSSAAMEMSKNKILTHQQLAFNHIPTPKTLFGAHYSYDSLCIEFNQSQFIVKQLDGSKGENVFLIQSQAEFLHAIACCNHNCLYQEYIETSRGKDVRLWVIGNRVVASVLRYSETSFISNYSQGGKVKAFELDAEIEELALRSTRALGLDFAGVDVLFGDDGYLVCEVNGNAGFRTISSISDKSIPYHLMEYISNEISCK